MNGVAVDPHAGKGVQGFS